MGGESARRGRYAFYGRDQIGERLSVWQSKYQRYAMCWRRSSVAIGSGFGDYSTGTFIGRRQWRSTYTAPAL
jgi:hypothetical protein